MGAPDTPNHLPKALFWGPPALRSSRILWTLVVQLDPCCPKGCLLNSAPYAGGSNSWRQWRGGSHVNHGLSIRRKTSGGHGRGRVSASGLEGRASDLAPPAPQTSGRARTAPAFAGSLPRPDPTCGRIPSAAHPRPPPRAPPPPRRPPRLSPWARWHPDSAGHPSLSAPPQPRLQARLRWRLGGARAAPEPLGSGGPWGGTSRTQADPDGRSPAWP